MSKPQTGNWISADNDKQSFTLKTRTHLNIEFSSVQFTFRWRKITKKNKTGLLNNITRIKWSKNGIKNQLQQSYFNNKQKKTACRASCCIFVQCNIWLHIWDNEHSYIKIYFCTFTKRQPIHSLLCIRSSLFCYYMLLVVYTLTYPNSVFSFIFCVKVFFV